MLAQRKDPVVVLSLALPVAALAVVLLHLALAGPVHERDEGAAAHAFQLLLAAQLPLIAWWLPRGLARNARAALRLLALQLAATLTALAPVWWFGL